MAKPFAIHPGEILVTEFMEPYGLTAYRLAKELCVPAPRVNDIVRGKRAISADTALRLGIYFGLPAQFWLNLQNDYDLRFAANIGAPKEDRAAHQGSIERTPIQADRKLELTIRFATGATPPQLFLPATVEN